MVDLNTKEGPSSVVVGGRIRSQCVPKYKPSVLIMLHNSCALDFVSFAKCGTVTGF